VTRGRVSASVYSSPLRHLDRYRISYHYILHIYSLALICNRTPLHHTSAVKRRRTSLYIIFDFSVIGYLSLTRIHEFYLYCQRTRQPTENEQLAHQFYLQSSTMPPEKLPDINCAWLVHVRPRKTYDLLSRVTPIPT